MPRDIPVIETKGPVGEEAAPVPPSQPNLAQLIADQAEMAKALQQMGPLLFATAAKSEKLAERLEQAETNVGELAEVVRQMWHVLQTVLGVRRV